MQELSDEQLVLEQLAGNERALEILVQRYLNQVYNFVFKYVHTVAEAEDVTSETFFKIWHNLAKFDNKYKFKSWAFTIAKNTALDHLKRRGLVPFSALEDSQDGEVRHFSDALVSTAPLPEELMHRIDDVSMLNLAVAKLPEKYRTVLDMYYEQGFNLREIAALLKQSLQTIKTRHRRALIYLKKEILEKKTAK